MNTYKVTVLDESGKARKSFILQLQKPEHVKLCISKELEKASFDPSKETVEVLNMPNATERLSVDEAKNILKGDKQ